MTLVSTHTRRSAGYLRLSDEESRAQDWAWIAQWRAGDESAFTALIKKYSKPIQAQMRRLYFYRMDGDESHEVSSDLVQEMWWRVYKHRDNLNPEKKFSAYVYTIATNLAKNELRNRARRDSTVQRMPLMAHDDDESGAVEYPDMKRDSRPDDALIAAERWERFEAALLQLPEDQRRVVQLRMEGKSYDEIAQAVGAALGTVKSRLHRAKEGLHALLLELQDA